MKNRELLDFKNSNYLSHGFPAILEKVQPIMDEFIDEMISRLGLGFTAPYSRLTFT